MWCSLQRGHPVAPRAAALGPAWALPARRDPGSPRPPQPHGLAHGVVARRRANDPEVGQHSLTVTVLRPSAPRGATPRSALGPRCSGQQPRRSAGPARRGPAGRARSSFTVCASPRALSLFLSAGRATASLASLPLARSAVWLVARGPRRASAPAPTGPQSDSGHRRARTEPVATAVVSRSGVPRVGELVREQCDTYPVL